MTYSLIRLTAPAELAVSLAEVKAQSRIDFDDEDPLFARNIDAAIGWLDGADGWLGRALITQEWRITFDRFMPTILLPLPPVQSVEAVTYVDLAGATQTLDPGDYVLTGVGGAAYAKLRPASGTSWPPTIREPECVTIDFTAGYGDNSTDIPEPIRAAIIARVAQLYENRETPPEPPYDLVQSYRVWVV